MADYRKCKEESVFTDGGEARPRPHKAQRLMDVMGWEAPRRHSEAPETPPLSDHVSLAHPVSTMSTVPPARADIYAILAICPEGEGETLAVSLSVPAFEAERVAAGKEISSDGKPVQLKLHLLVEQYTDLSLHVGEITPEQADNLIQAGRLCAAIRRGMALLQYGDQSARRLVFKLTAKGIDREVATEAADYLTKKGYIREDDTARLRAGQNVRKGWGPRRIHEDLRAQGFTPDAVEEAMAALEDVDFEANCVALIRKKYGCIPDDRAARQKMIAAILRLGYDMDTIREAMLAVLRDG